MPRETHWKMAKIAKLYYEEGLTQEAIATRLHFSRSTVSRLLDGAKKHGMVEIKIHFPWQRAEDLEESLCQKYGLKSARVLKRMHNCTHEELLEGLGVLGAQYLQGILKPNIIIAISSGNGVYQTVRSLESRKLNATVVQVMGVVGCDNPLIDGPELAQLLVHRLGGRYIYMQAPLVIKNPQVHKQLFQEPPIQEVLSYVKNAEVALVGVGTVNPFNSSLLRNGISPEALKQLTMMGAIGETCGQPFDRFGRQIVSDWSEQIVTIDLKHLTPIPVVVGVAGGLAKAEAIHGAVTGHLLDVLITDQQVAEKLLD